MTAQNKTIIKSYFETGDKPTQGQFADFIDSYVDTLSAIGNAQALATSGGTGLINITSPSSASLTTAGTVGLQIFATNTTAAAQQVLGGGTVGRLLFQTITTAAAVNQLGASTIGTQLFQATTTAAALNSLGGGTVGIQIFQATTTAAAQSIVGGSTSGMGTVVSASGTGFNTTSIPSNANEVTLMFRNISTNGTSPVIVQLVTSAGTENTGYIGAAQTLGVAAANFSSGFIVHNGVDSAALIHGPLMLTMLNSSTNEWDGTSNLNRSDTATSPTCVGSGNKSIASTLYQLRITTAGGTDTFDNGYVNIQYRT